MVVLTADQTKEGHLHLEFFRTPDFGLNNAEWQIIIDKLGQDEEKRTHDVMGDGETVVSRKPIKEENVEDLDEVMSELDEVEEFRVGRRQGLMQSSRVERSVHIPQTELALSSLHRDYSSFPRIVGQFPRLVKR